MEALPSCELIRFEVQPVLRVLEHLSKDGVTVAIRIYDVDNQPVNFSLPKLNVYWRMLSSRHEDGTPSTDWGVPYKRQQTGSHVFTSAIGADRFVKPGRSALPFDLSVMSLELSRCGLQVHVENFARQLLELVEQ